MLVALVDRIRNPVEGSNNGRVVSTPLLPVPVDSAVSEGRVLSALLPSRSSPTGRKLMPPLRRHEMRVADGIAPKSCVRHDLVALARGHRRSFVDRVNWRTDQRCIRDLGLEPGFTMNESREELGHAILDVPVATHRIGRLARREWRV